MRTRAYTPRTNGKAERLIQTLLREWAYVKTYAKSRRRTATLLPYLRYYNRRRPHAGCGALTPMKKLSAPREQPHEKRQLTPHLLRDM